MAPVDLLEMAPRLNDRVKRIPMVAQGKLAFRGWQSGARRVEIVDLVSYKFPDLSIDAVTCHGD